MSLLARTFSLLHIEPQNVLDTIKTSQKPLVMMFSAPNWCRPCQVLSPVITDVAESYPDVDFAHIDIDEANEVAWALGVRTVPHIISFKEGLEVDSFVGGQPREFLEEFFSRQK